MEMKWTIFCQIAQDIVSLATWLERTSTSDCKIRKGKNRILKCFLRKTCLEFTTRSNFRNLLLVCSADSGRNQPVNAIRIKQNSLTVTAAVEWDKHIIKAFLGNNMKYICIQNTCARVFQWMQVNTTWCWHYMTSQANDIKHQIFIYAYR